MRCTLAAATLVAATLVACAAQRQPAGPATSATPSTAPASASASIACSSCAEWNGAREPFQIHGSTYFVGVSGLSAVLIKTTDGLILLDGALPQSADAIAASIRKLGFRPESIRLIVNSHAHFDHAGGIAALQAQSGARVAASASGARALRSGYPTSDDPQASTGGQSENRFPAVTAVEVVKDGQTITIGDVTLTAHLTPGHTPGSTTWSWRSCSGTPAQCLDVVYADSLNAVSDDGFAFTPIAATFRHSIDTVAHLPCDILVSVHPGFAQLDDKLAARAKGVTPDPFIDPAVCQRYAATAADKLEQRLAKEQSPQ